MSRPPPLRWLLPFFILSGCVAPRLYSEQELSQVGRACGLAEGEVVQEAEEPRILFLYAAQPSPDQLGCVRRWSRRHNLHLAFIAGIDWNNN